MASAISCLFWVFNRSIMRYFCPTLLCVFLLLSCQNAPVAASQSEANEPTSARYHVLWLVAEDLSPLIPPFGDSTVATPNLSRLAAEGIRYPNLFSVSGVCAPSRSAIATGMYPISIGSMHMRTSSRPDYMAQIGITPYEAIPPPEARMMSEVLREHGYYCSNNAKQDYQFKAPVTAWDDSSPYAHWANRPAGQPFFSVFNFDITHESNLFSPPSTSFERWAHLPTTREAYKIGGWNDRLPEEDWVFYVPEDLEVPRPPYLADTDSTRRDLRRVYSNIVEMDRQVGIVLDQLEADGLLDSTIIFWYTDHGGPLPRQKRLLYDSGIRVPLIVRFPDQRGAGTIDSQLISFVDLAPTVFSLADIPVPAYVQGRAFLGTQRARQPREYVFAAADRFDTEYDRIRAVRDQRYKYLRNYRPDQPYYLPVTYRENIPAMRELLRGREAGTLDSIQLQWFRESKPLEELFDTYTDPHELRNLAGDPAYAAKLRELREANESFLLTYGDLGAMPEADFLATIWPEGSQPATAAPTVAVANGTLHLRSATPGASLGYRWSPDMAWQVFTGPVALPETDSVEVVAHRIGFAPAYGSVAVE